MLKLVFGRDRTERARSIALAIALLVAATALIQLRIERSTTAARVDQETAALELARNFATALTTYDYAHPEIQVRALRSTADSSVVADVVRGQHDLYTAHASGLGEAGAAWLAQHDGASADAVVEVSEMITNDFSGKGRTVRGLLECHVARTGGNAWRVVGFQWLNAPVTDSIAGGAGDRSGY